MFLDVTKFVLFALLIILYNNISALSVQRYNFFINNTTINIFFLVVSWWSIKQARKRIMPPPLPLRKCQHAPVARDEQLSQVVVHTLQTDFHDRGQA